MNPISARGGCQQYGETWAHQEPNGASSSAHSQAYQQKDAVPPANCPSTQYDRTHYLWPPLMAEAAGKPILCCGCYAEGRSSGTMAPGGDSSLFLSFTDPAYAEKLEVAPPSPGQLRHGYVEALASRLGLSIPDLTPKQADMWQTRLSAHLNLPGASCISVSLLQQPQQELILAVATVSSDSLQHQGTAGKGPEEAQELTGDLKSKSNEKASNDCEKCQCRLEVMSCISRMQLEGAGAKKPLQGPGAVVECCNLLEKRPGEDVLKGSCLQILSDDTSPPPLFHQHHMH
ncbi:hypothetical protein IHE44_0001252 [Lamprotornis superbus]|uniref:Uncharacterized protein n=1 Tax=Lamprotornis superbus TaxID=245042 RepID=A0A835NTC8_9PASS|nr:hypothetical protein IHE44_0001252 [Lamprotornis superbus]